jgi:hypothetical protein
VRRGLFAKGEDPKGRIVSQEGRFPAARPDKMGRVSRAGADDSFGLGPLESLPLTAKTLWRAGLAVRFRFELGALGVALLRLGVALLP